MMEVLHIAYKAIRANKLRATIALLVLATIITTLVILGHKFHEQFTMENIEYLIKEYGYYLIFTLVMLGNMGVPVPEESPVIIAGFAVQLGLMDYKTACLVCITSAIIGDNIGYLIGRKGGRALILRFGSYVGINDERLRKFEGFFERYGDKTVFFARFIAGLRWVAGPLSGAARMPFHRFLMFNALGAVVWVIVMTQIGYHFGRQLPLVFQWLSKVNTVIFIVAAIVIGTIYYLRKKKREKAAAANAANAETTNETVTKATAKTTTQPDQSV